MNQSEPLSAEERAACAVCADWLSTGALWSHTALLAMAAVLFAAATGSRLGSMQGVLISLLAIGLIERYLALRVALDARLFDRLAQGQLLDLPSLDKALQQVLSVPAIKAGRDLPSRVAGAQRLYRVHVSVTLLLIALSIVAWFRY